jgi:2-desacetyl-2-hydroxyethyl bacteriochlorophyllide A dehydrogenase
MKAGILYADRDIRVGEAPDPQIKPDEVLIETGFAGICGTDLHIFRGEFHSRVKFPAIQGHEFGGVIVEAGADARAKSFQPGMRVAVDPIMPCYTCPACLVGHLNTCRTLKLLGVDLDGGYGQYVAVPFHRLYVLPDEVPIEAAPMVEMYALGHHILQRGKVQPGETIALLGAGKLGLSILDVLCHSASPSQAFVTDLQPQRLKIAQNLGASHLINIHEVDPVETVLAMTDGVGVDCVIEAVGHYHELPGREAPLAQAVKMVRNGGRIVTTGLGEQLSPVHFKTLVIKEAEIIASRVTLGEFPRAIRMMAQGLLHPNLLITQKLALKDITAAFEKVDLEDPDTIKIVMDIQAA